MLLDKSLALFFFLFSAVYLYTATGYSFGALSAPHAGFLPHVVGAAGIALTGINLLRVFFTSETAGYETRFVRAVFFCAGMAAYVAALPVVGFATATFALTFYLLKVSEARGWLSPLLIAAATAAGIYVGFAQLLNVPLP